jgi:hypothetical protein
MAGEVRTMDGGVSAGLRRVCRSIAFVFFTVMSAYLVLELVIALSAQGEPTGAVAPFTGAEVVYPAWYQAPELLDCLRVALIAYPAAVIFYGLAAVAGWVGRLGAPGTPRSVPAEASPALSPTTDDGLSPMPGGLGDLCFVGDNRRVLHIAPAAARLFGLTPQQMAGLSLERFIVPADLPKLDALIAAAYADSPRPFTATVGILLPEAAIAPVEITCRAGGADAMQGAMTLTIRPFSERGRLDDQLAALWY